MQYAAVLMEPTASHAFPSSERIVQNLQPSERLSHILETGEDFYHTGQQTNKMLRDHNRRRRISHQCHRDALLELIKEHGSIINLTNDMLSVPNINPFEVTLTMQIHEGDCGIIYKRSVPDSLTQIMNDTETLIRFPDRGEEGVTSCQVTVKGTLKNVETARSRLRQLTTLTISFHVEGARDYRAWLDQTRKNLKLSRIIHYEVCPPQRKQIFEKPTIRVSGTFAQEEVIVKAVSKLRQAFYAEAASEVLLITEITVPAPQMEMFMGGHSAEQLVAIARNADVFLHFLPPSNQPCHTEFRNFIITGRTPEGVIRALKIMTALQPVQLSFEVLGEDVAQEVEPTQTKKIFDDKKLVHIHITPSLKQFDKLPEEPVIHFVCMTAQEYNIGSIYAILKSFLRKELDTDNEIPVQKPPNFMTSIAKQFHITSSSLDIQNCEFPEKIMDQPSPHEKGDVLLLEKSVDPDDMELYPDAVTHSASNIEGIPAGFAFSYQNQREILGFLNAQELAGGSMPRELFSSRSDMDNRYDSDFVHTRGFFNKNFRGRRPGGSFAGDKRNTNTFPRNRYNNKERDYGGKNDFSKNRNEADRQGMHEEPRRGRQYFPKRNVVDEYSIDGYLKHYMRHPPDYRKAQTQDKILLLNKKTPGSHNSTMEDDADLPKRMTAKDLIEKANEEMSSGSANTSNYSDNSRISYARMVGGSSFTENSENGNVDTVSNEKGRKRSSSLSESNKYPSYGRDSPFSAGMRQLDRRVDVDHVLFSLNCEKYLENFRKAKIITLPMLVNLEERDLAQLGVGSNLDRNTIMEYIYKLRHAQAHPNHAITSRSAC